MRISFHGAAGVVTGSCHLVEANGQTILIDCGMFQGGEGLDEDNSQAFGFDPNAVDLLLLTHAHLDHCGRIPLLVKRGFTGEIIATPATCDLTRLVLMDAAGLNEEEARRRTRHGLRSAALYDSLDALDAIDRFGRKAKYRIPIDLGHGLRASFFEAGHILGSASILLEVREQGKRHRILFSGDIGPATRPLLNEAAPPGDADIVVMETTYGARDHRPLVATLDEFYGAINAAEERGGNIVIPTFALERAQELLFYLRAGMEAQRIRPSWQVFLDSPMAISATRIYRRHPGLLKPAIAEMLHSGEDPFYLPGLHFTQAAADSTALNRIRSGAILIAGSGMCTGGRVRHHLRHNLGQVDGSVIFVGFAAEGTLARIILDGATSVKLMGDEIPVRAHIHTINGFSAHAGRSDLLAWHARTGTPAITFLVHGEDMERQALADALEGRMELPRLHQSYEV